MSTVKYKTTIIKVGDLVSDFMESNILVFFGPNAPDEVVEFSIIHEHPATQAEVKPGDQIVLTGQSYEVCAVGEVANSNLQKLGHFVLKFNGLTKPQMPGDICLEAVDQLPEVTVGTFMQVVTA